ncbi:MAG: O-antigen ligase family protein [Rhodospirillales bacterium]
MTLEPSYFARFLAPATLVLVVLLGEGVGPRRPLVACLVLFTVAMLLSTSTIGYVGLMLTGVVACALYARRLLPLLGAIGALTGAVLLAFPRALTAVLSVTVDKSESGSYEYRLWTMQQGYDAFATAPFFGHGWGWYAGGAVASVHDFLFKMLSSVGVVGLAIYMVFLATSIVQSLGALRALTGYRTGRTLSPAVAAEAAQLRALLLGFSGAFCLIFILDALATFSFFIGQQWFLLGAMVGMSHLTNQWIAGRVEADRLGQTAGAAGTGDADPSGRRRRSAGGVGVTGAA